MRFARISVFVLGLLLPAGSARAADSLSAGDKKFLTDAAKAGMMEIQMGRLGQSAGSSEAVKAFAKRMVDDHSKADSELKALAQEKKIDFPLDHSASMPTPLIGMEGEAFDKAYAKQAVADHEKAVALFQNEAKSGSDPDVKAWANSMLSTLQSHLDAAKGLPGK
jgi:putative membrane protein